MKSSKVWFTNLRTKPSQNLLKKLENLIIRAGIEKIDFRKKMTAIKIHFGEPGNLAYLRPNYAAHLVKMLKSREAIPFLTDCNTLYYGRRSNAPSHLEAAFENGYNPLATDCPVIIADGIKGTEYREISINLDLCKTAKIGSAIADADIIITMNHFKGHELTGFGGALKNLGMGCASVGGKLFLHSGSSPKIHEENCTGCRICEKYCAHDAIRVGPDKIAHIDYEKCVGCGQCVAVCQYDSARVVWKNASDIVCKKVSEYAYAAILDKPSFHINFIIDVSPNCDCWDVNDYPVVADIGIAASFDPVALDQASADMVKAAPALQGSRICKDYDHGDLRDNDKFKLTHPDTFWQAGIEHAEKIGLGNISYNLISV
ncbi:MAG: 4Fe-4S ferredoxin [Bacteroidetes bacterium RBG_13_43_22]|nr:MAG: 4Fe-4S ferredoxin [Bacteroidetes bacterium RBG_13_43_22]